MNQQTNTQVGDIQVIASESLVGKEGFLAVLINSSNVLNCRLPDTVIELAMFVIIEGAALGSPATLRPLSIDREVRVRLNGTVVPGALLKLDAINGTDDGKCCTIGTVAGQYFSPGIAEEVGADEQWLKIRCLPRLVNVASAHVGDPAAAAAMTQDTLTDSSGGTAGTTIAAIGATYTQAEVRNAVATLAAQLAKVKTDVAAVRTASEANKTAIIAVNAVMGDDQKITAAS